jgi:hypothetical protein
MRNTELAIVIGVISILVLAYGFNLIYAHQVATSNGDHEAEGYGYHHGCHMEDEHEEMMEHHNQMMYQWMEQYSENLTEGFGC